MTEDNCHLLHKPQAAPTGNVRLLGLLCTTKANPISSAHACSARFLNKSFRALARTSNLMKICVSTDHLPPTSKDNQPRTAPWTNKFRVPTFLPLACDGQSRSILLNRASPGLTIGMESTHEGRVDC